MKQPVRKKKVEKVGHITGTGKGIDTCNECPFLSIVDGVSICSTSDIILGKEKTTPVPDWCGNKKDKNENT